MKSLYCDICKEEITEPVNERNYFHIREYDICEPCKDAIEAKLRPILREHEPFTTEWYEDEMLALIEQACEAGKP